MLCTDGDGTYNERRSWCRVNAFCTAEQLNQPGLATQVGTLRLILIGPSSSCVALQLAKATERARSARGI